MLWQDVQMIVCGMKRDENLMRNDRCTAVGLDTPDFLRLTVLNISDEIKSDKMNIMMMIGLIY